MRVIFPQERLSLLLCHTSGRPTDPLTPTAMGIKPPWGVRKLKALGQDWDFCSIVGCV